MNSGTHSEGRQMPEIESLTALISRLSHKVDFWNLVMLWGLGIAAVAAIVVGLATRLVILRQGELAQAQDQLSEAKDRQLQTDLKAADTRIADATKAGSEAIERSKALEAEAARLNKVAEDERLARVKLETDLLKQGPRAALLQDPQRRQRFVNSLLPFAGQKFTVNKCGAPMPVDTDLHRVTFMLTSILETAAKWTNTMRSLTWVDQGTSCGSLGVLVSVKPNASAATHDSGEALVLALRALPFTMVRLDDTEGQRLPGTIPVPFDAETVVITVFERPYTTAAP